MKQSITSSEIYDLIHKQKIGTPINEWIIQALDVLYQERDPIVVYKDNECYVLEGHCLGTKVLTLFHVIVVKNKDEIYVRGTRGDEAFKRFKLWNKLNEKEVNYL